MKLLFTKSDLTHAVQTVQASISTKSTLPILSNLLIYVSAPVKNSTPKVYMEATDLEVGVRCTVKAEIVQAGKITIPAKKFGELIREMPEDKEIELSSGDGKRIDLKCGKVRATLHALPPEDFPTIPQFPDSEFFQLNKSVFRDMVRKTSFAISTDETRHVLNGILFAVNDGELRMVATDGRRLALISRDGAEKKSAARVIIPSKAINELLRLLALSEAQEEDWVQIAPSQNQIAFKWMNSEQENVIVSRVIDGTFPNYDQVIPKSKEIELKINRSEILSAVRRASLFAQDRGGSVKFSLAKKVLKISANAQGVGEEEEELEVNYDGPNFEIAFNPAFLLDVLKNNDQPEVLFEFSTALNPGVIKPSTNNHYTCVIMPMRLQ